MEISEINQLRKLDEEERIAWTEYAETKSQRALDTISECTKEKARLYGESWPDKPTARIIVRD